MTYNHSSRVLASAGDDSCIVLSNTESNDRLAHFEPTSFSPSPINSIAFTSNSDKLGCGALDGSVRIWDLRKKEVSASFNHHTDSVSCVTWNYTDQQIASSSLSGEIIIHSLLTKVAVANFKQRGSAGIKVIQFSPFKKQVLGVGSENGSVYIWDTNSRSVISSFLSSHNSPVTGLAFSAVNDMLMCTSGLDQRINFYDTQDKKLVKTIEADAPLTCISFCTDGHTLAGGTLYGTVLLYDLRMPGSTKNVLRGHEGNAVNWVEFSKVRDPRKPQRELSREPAKQEYLTTATSKFRTVEEIKLEARMRVEQKKKERMKEKDEEKQDVSMQKPPIPTILTKSSMEPRENSRSPIGNYENIIPPSPARENVVANVRVNNNGGTLAATSQILKKESETFKKIAEEPEIEINIRALDNSEGRSALEMIEKRLDYQDDAIFEVKEDIQNLQIEMIRQFMIQMV